MDVALLASPEQSGGTDCLTGPETVWLWCGSHERAIAVLIRACAVTRGGAGWSSPVARQAHNLKVAGSNPAPATRCAKVALEKATVRK